MISVGWTRRLYKATCKLRNVRFCKIKQCEYRAFQNPHRTFPLLHLIDLENPHFFYIFCSVERIASSTLMWSLLVGAYDITLGLVPGLRRSAYQSSTSSMGFWTLIASESLPWTTSTRHFGDIRRMEGRSVIGPRQDPPTTCHRLC